MLGTHTPSKRPALRRVLVVVAAVFIGAALGGLAMACGSDDQAEEDFLTYWNAVEKIQKKATAESDKAGKKADRTEGAMNAYAAWLDEVSDAYKREATRMSAVVPPESLAKVHKAYVDSMRSSALAMHKVAARITAEIEDSDFTELTDDDWLDRVSKPSDRALERASSAFDRYYAAIKTEGTRLGIEFTSE
jgi:hypothetical protein